eukprot:5674025-Amphidinium_carterae.1
MELLSRYSFEDVRSRWATLEQSMCHLNLAPDEVERFFLQMNSRHAHAAPNRSRDHHGHNCAKRTCAASTSL